MIAYALRRLASLVVVMALVGICVFMLLHLAPGDPAAIIAGDNASPAQIAAIRKNLGLDDTIFVQFWRWATAVLSGDFGVSIFSNAPVGMLIKQRLEPTVSLTLATLLFAVPTALLLGVLSAWLVGTTVDRLAMAVSVLGFAAPTFVVGYVMIYVFAITLKWLPVQGYAPFGNGVTAWARHLVLPALTLGLAYVALIARITRATMLDVLAEDYIRTAKAKGVETRAVLMKHALRNAGVPVVTVIGIGVALLIGGVVVTETVFNIPGIGRLVVDAISKRDYPIIQGVILVFSAVYVIINLLVDLSYTLIDPRIRYWTEAPAFSAAEGPAAAAPRRAMRPWRFIRRNPSLVAGGFILAIFAILALAAPWLPGDPLTMKPSNRLLPPGGIYPLGTDALGRDVMARVIHGARVSLFVGFSVAIMSVTAGLAIGLIAGAVRPTDTPLMRLMDALMAIPAILLAIALISLTQASVTTVIIAITIPEIPRVVRLVRSVVLSVREQPYIEAAIAGGARMPKIILRHILPSTIPALIVQATYICASAILVEATLSFLGAGAPPEIPSWGNMIASSRLYLARAPWTIFCPGLALALVVLAVNLLGDGLRDRLDPRLARRM